MKKLVAITLLFFPMALLFGQTTAFDNLNANAYTGKAITWNSSSWGNGFGHRIINSDPGGFTLLNFQGRDNSSTWVDIMSITSDGKIGVGTTSPLGKLHVSSATSGDAVFRLEADTDNNNESDNPEIVFVQDGGAVNGFIGFEGNANTKSIGTLANAFILGSEDNTIVRPIQVISGDEVQMTIEPNGIGIGTTSPLGKLHVSAGTSGDAIFRLEADTDNNNESDNPLIQIRQDGGLLGVNMGFSEGNFGGNIFGIGTRYSGQESWDAFTINTSNGNVGIGTKNAGSWRLAVKGKIRAEEIKVETGWADYVLKEDYDLPTLEEVEKHIQEKGHLINIPSAKEVEENGIQLGEMNKLLLEKIEELTLYVIALKKENENQQNEIEQLKKHPHEMPRK